MNDSGPNDPRPTTASTVTLASILNILWRRRLIVLGLPALGLVVGLLYGVFGTKRWSATLTIRPGITAFDPSGGAHRQWQLKDITRWYDMKLYQQGLVDRLGLPEGSKPVIKAEFVAQGLQNLQGGDVITLWTTETGPELAAAVLDSSLAVFVDYAEADTVSSQLKLTRDGLLLQIQELENELVAIDQREAEIGLLLEQARAESLLVVAEDQGFALELERQKALTEYYGRRLVDLQEAEPRLLSDLTQLDRALHRVAAGGDLALEDVEIPERVRRSAILDRGDVLESLTRAKLELESALDRNRATQDTTALGVERSRLRTAQLEIERETSIRARTREAISKIGSLELERDYDLPSQRRTLAHQIAERQVKLNIIAPLQRVGQTVVSDEPVRPRTLRATLILVFLGAIGGFVLAFVWDYVMAHRDQIFRGG
ncbi:hypothetical protein GF314_16100 [bacterium]|nr:hypothetical protein [bacterium]